MAANWGTRENIDQNYYYLPSTYNTDLEKTFAVNEADGTTVAASALIETSYDLVLHQNPELRSKVNYFYVGENSSLSVYGDVVKIFGKIKAPGQTIRIFCRELEVIPVDGEAAIVVDGKPGDAHNEPIAAAAAGSSAQDATREQREGQTGATGAEGRPGGKGGEIAIVCGHFTKGATLSLSANGGKGGSGQRGQAGGRGGAGARGEDWVHYQTPHENHPQRPVRIRAAIRGGEGGRGGWGGLGGTAGVGGKGGSVIISGASDLVLGSAAPGPNGDPGEGGKGGDGGTGGPPGQPAPHGVRGPGCYDYKYIGSYGEKGETGASLGKGKAGPDRPWALMKAFDAARRGGRGTQQLFDAVITFEDKGFQVAGLRQLGNYAVKFEDILENMQDVCRKLCGAGTVWVKDPKNFPKDWVRDFVHVSQLQMVFHKARMHYLAAGEALAKPDGELDKAKAKPDGELDKAEVLLNWLSDVLDAVIAANPQPDVAGQAHSLESRVLALRMNIFRRLNYFKRLPDYVPRQSFDQYAEWLTNSLASLKTVEKQHTDLYTDLKTKTELTLNLANCASVITDQKKFLAGQKKRVDEEMKLALSAIAAAEKVVANAKTATRIAIDSYTRENNKLLSFPPVLEMLNMMEMIAFMPHGKGAGPFGAIMAGAQAGKFLNAVATANGELHAAGGTYKKEYALHQLDSLGDEFKTLDDAITISKKNPDALKEMDTRKLGLLLTTKDKWDQVVKEFYTKDTSKASKLVQQAMAYYVDQVLERNEKVLEYNDLLRQWYDLNTRLAALDSKLWVGETQSAKQVSPGLPMMMAFVDDLYERAKDQCLDDLYKAARACAFWSLKNFSLFADFLGKKHLHEVNHTILAAGQKEVLKELRDALEGRARPPQESGAKTIHLKKLPEVLEKLKKDGVAKFILPPARKETRADDDKLLQQKFHGMADVRLTKLRAWADLEVKEGENRDGKLHHLVLTHLGNETLVTTDNQERKFYHVPVETTIIYLVAKMPTQESDPGNDAVDRVKYTNVQDGEIKDLQELSGKRVFSEIGPFSEWQIEIPDRDNLGLDRSKLKDVRIDFHCTSQTLVR